MSTKGLFISQARNQLRMINADYKLPNRFIWSIIDKHLRWLINEDSNKLRLVRNNTIFQTWKCVDVIPAPTIDDCCGVASRCTVQRTAIKAPDLYEDTNGVIVKSVFSIDGSTDFKQITVQEYMRKLENPNSKYDKSNYFYYNNGWFYFPNSSIRKVMIKGHFINDISEFNQCDGIDIDPCRTRLDDNLNFPSYILGRLMDFVIKDLSMTRQIPDDPQINKIENQ